MVMNKEQYWYERSINGRDTTVFIDGEDITLSFLTADDTEGTAQTFVFEEPVVQGSRRFLKLKIGEDGKPLLETKHGKVEFRYTPLE